MTRDAFGTLCTAHPKALVSGSGKPDARKVGGKMFAYFGHADKRALNTDKASVKCPDVETEEAAHRIAVSHDTVWAALPKKIREAL